MLIEISGLVIKTVNLSDNDTLLTIFSAERGKITAVANGSRTLKSRYLAATQLFCYSSFVLHQRGERFWVREVSLIESFFDLRSELERTALASYFCDVNYDVVEENVKEPELLRLTLNALYAICQGKHDLPKIKASFEMRAVAVLGFCPILSHCANCGKNNGNFILDVMNGIILCEDCRSIADTVEVSVDEIRTARIICPLTEGALAAMRYVVTCPLERIFAFQIPASDMSCFEKAAEKYLLNQLERGFGTLDFYKQIAP